MADFRNPPPRPPVDPRIQERRDEIQRKKDELQNEVKSLMRKGQDEDAALFFQQTETDDIESEYRRLLAASKKFALLDKDFKAGLDLCRQILKDMISQLHVNQKRDKQTQRRLQGILDLVKDPDKIEDREKHVAALESLIAKFDK